MYKLSDISYEFLEPQELSSPAECVIKLSLSGSNELKYKLMGAELDPNYMTTDRLYHTLFNELRKYRVTNFESMLDDFVVKFVSHIRQYSGMPLN